MAVQNSLANKKKPMGISAYLKNDAVKTQINDLMGSDDGLSFAASIVAAVQQNPALKECTNQSIVSAALQGHTLGLSPSPQLGQFYMVPFKNKKTGTTEAQFQIGYRGLIQLASRSGYYKKINAVPIKEGELVRYDPLNEEIEVRLIENETKREHTPTCGYYAMFEYSNGFRKAMYWSKEKMAAHAERYSFAFARNGGLKSLELLEAGKIPEKDMWKYSSFWFKDFDAMANKTLIRQLINHWGVMSIKMQKAMDEDDTEKLRNDGTVDYVEMEDAQDDGIIDAPDVVVEEPETVAPQPAPVEDDDPFADYM